ncbi:FliG C-terminal domain-containing protein [Thiomicrorhabdus aquaedulcis]|uniref:FliG C-terminal domain-containing protein n=1 Tax=Thiomicrorhabdus aquaedulcis TaxID=2211106 RepID=UPI000FD6C3B2|nr:FliG C-terminal domain-containing protein [Thiomicrorhabdus aquaedulcis]
MKVGIKKQQENEWLVHIGCGAVKMDRFAVELLSITLEHLLALERGESHSTLKSYIKLGLRLKELKPLELQKLLREVDNQDVLVLMMVARDAGLSDSVISNIGGIMAKQLHEDLQKATMPSEETAKEAIKRVVEKLFELEGLGQIEFVNDRTQYI